MRHRGKTAQRSILWQMAYSLDVMTVRSNDEGGVIVRVVVRAQPWRTVVFAACFRRCTVERIDLAAALRCECKVQRNRTVRALVNPERRLTVATQAGPMRSLHCQADSQRRKSAQKKCFAGLAVAGTDADVIEHEFSHSRIKG
ncbi:MAG: hypothetical protein ABS94_00020 [Variovorax sp. SCN 67-85]|nr:MAG: hypothetical protein ABS94_00020 [Variovorax sp. SCN 67-85]ODV25186.1 MAG: hypothetical protein ABT25_10360 [Variovorax sp. SCN 67-20]